MFSFGSDSVENDETNDVISSLVGDKELHSLASDWQIDDMGRTGVDRNEAGKLITDALRPINDKLSAIAEYQTETRDLIKTEIEKQVKLASNSGWQKARQAIISVGTPAAIVSVFLAMLAISVGALYQSFSHVREETAFRANTDSRLRAIENALKIPHPAPLQSHEIDKIRPAASEARAKPREGSTNEETNDNNKDALRVDPDRYLASVRTKILSATDSSRPLPKAEFADYVSAVREAPSSLANYWRTVAAIVNYQSALNQKNGEAPDPMKVSKPCALFQYSMIEGPLTISNCVFDIDTNSFYKVTFVNCVVRYHNRSVELRNVRFHNCRFILDDPPTVPEIKQQRFLQALLDSSDQRSVAIGS